MTEYLVNCRNQYLGSIEGMKAWCEDIYNTRFSSYFRDQRDIGSSIRSKSRPISDEELEKILTEVPMNLFDVSERLSELRTESEVIKLEVKRKEIELAKISSETTEVKRKEEAAVLTTEDKILLMAYDNIITRVEKEMSYSRELIMSAKKIWDGRKSTTNPVGEITSNLPDYNYSQNKSYIK